MIDIEAEALAIVHGQGEAWSAAVEKLEQAWTADDPAAIAAWQAVFSRYVDLAYKLNLDKDGFYDYQIYKDSVELAGGYDPRPEPPMTKAEQAALKAEEAAFQAECDAGLHQPPVHHPTLDDDIPF
ncbi:hypothetical protein P7D22_11455 [Lichenihabitans sp. Uapishka_5]|uniref:hypothetical protein n=1 Tax=Lichenihabitans sp. Uapishka_5 TaxID=3037302 RepID=UPI0029E81F9B|nr:hypothetical protein [Lichenihabitans sp. Uapishka_5]MDX7951785.1 hypothetical protein [Lichenihabitans sp. Uapishka_5]